MTQSKPRFTGVQFQGQTIMGVRAFSAPFTYQDGLVNEARLVHVLRGHSSLVCAGKTLDLTSGDTLLMKADNFINQWLTDGKDKAVEFIGIRFTQSLLQQVYEGRVPERVNPADGKKPVHSESAIVIPHDTLLASYFQNLYHYIHRPQNLRDDLLKLKVIELIELIMTLDPQGQLHDMFSQLFVPSQPKLQEVVQAHICTPLKVSELAFLCHMSESTFTRKFLQVYGTSVNKYLTEKRLQKAQQLIKATEKSMTEIALECGFEDVSYFSRTFKRHFAVTPSQLRK